MDLYIFFFNFRFRIRDSVSVVACNSNSRGSEIIDAMNNDEKKVQEIVSDKECIWHVHLLWLSGQISQKTRSVPFREQRSVGNSYNAFFYCNLLYEEKVYDNRFFGYVFSNS